jgi:hypothetical protein
VRVFRCLSREQFPDTPRDVARSFLTYSSPIAA